MFEFDVAAGGKVPAAHSHDSYEETIYGLEGVLTMTLEDGGLKSGRMKCCASRAARYTASTTFIQWKRKRSRSSPPAFLGPEFFREIAAILKSAAGGPPDHAAIAAVMRRHGLSPAP